MVAARQPTQSAAISVLPPATETLLTGDGLKLHLRRWLVPSTAPGAVRGTVQIVHGLGEHIDRYEALAQALNGAGWHVVGHDLRGHGRSQGARGAIAGENTHLLDLSAVIDHLRSPGKHVLLGHSLGGLIAARFVSEALTNKTSRWSRDVDGLVLSSPALNIGLGRVRRKLVALLARVLPGLPLGNGLKPEWISRDPEVVAQYKADPLVHRRVTPRLVHFMLQAGDRVMRRAPRWRTPTLLLWAGADRCVVPAGSAAFAHNAPPAVLQAHEQAGLFHEIFNEPERLAVVAQLLTWLQRF